MTWASHHSQSQAKAAEAHEALRAGREEQARALFCEAARLEEKAIEALDKSKARTLGITAVSAAALWFKGRAFAEAARLAHELSTIAELPGFARQELRTILQATWNEDAQQRAGLSFVPGQVVVSVKGGEIVLGGAPLDLILDKVQTIQRLFYRTAEYMSNVPLRKKGPPSRQLQDRCRPWLFQSVPGSYQFSVSIQKPEQKEMFPTDEPEPEELTEKFLAILKAAVENPDEALKALVDSDEYRQTFLKITKNLAPTGKVFDRLEVFGVGDREPVILVPGTRKLITDSLKKDAGDRDEVLESDVITLRGVLRALNLDQDWLEVTVDGGNTKVRSVGETVDDVIGPMVNHYVTVRAKQGPRNTLLFLDIELD